MEILTIKQAAEKFNISVSKVRELVNTGKFPAAKIGVGWRIDAEKAEGYINVLITEKIASTKATAPNYRVTKRNIRTPNEFLARLKEMRKQNAKA